MGWTSLVAYGLTGLPFWVAFSGLFVYAVTLRSFSDSWIFTSRSAVLFGLVDLSSAALLVGFPGSFLPRVPLRFAFGLLDFARSTYRLRFCVVRCLVWFLSLAFVLRFARSRSFVSRFGLPRLPCVLALPILWRAHFTLVSRTVLGLHTHSRFPGYAAHGFLFTAFVCLPLQFRSGLAPRLTRLPRLLGSFTFPSRCIHARCATAAASYAVDYHTVQLAFTVYNSCPFGCRSFSLARCACVYTVVTRLRIVASFAAATLLSFAICSVSPHVRLRLHSSGCACVRCCHYTFVHPDLPSFTSRCVALPRCALRAFCVRLPVARSVWFHGFFVSRFALSFTRFLVFFWLRISHTHIYNFTVPFTRLTALHPLFCVLTRYYCTVHYGFHPSFYLVLVCSHTFFVVAFPSFSGRTLITPSHARWFAVPFSLLAVRFQLPRS